MLIFLPSPTAPRPHVYATTPTLRIVIHTPPTHQPHLSPLTPTCHAAESLKFLPTTPLCDTDDDETPTMHGGSRPRAMAAASKSSRASSRSIALGHPDEEDEPVLSDPICETIPALHSMQLLPDEQHATTVTRQQTSTATAM